jgi:hypothetical protein
MSPLPWSLGWSSPAVVRYPGFQKRARRADEKLARTGHFQRRLGRRHVAWALPVVAVDSLLAWETCQYVHPDRIKPRLSPLGSRKRRGVRLRRHLQCTQHYCASDGSPSCVRGGACVGSLPKGG